MHLERETIPSPIYMGGYSNTQTRVKKGIKFNNINEILYE